MSYTSEVDVLFYARSYLSCEEYFCAYPEIIGCTRPSIGLLIGESYFNVSVEEEEKYILIVAFYALFTSL